MPAACRWRTRNPRSATTTSRGAACCAAATSTVCWWAMALGSAGSARTTATGSPNRCDPACPLRATTPTAIAGRARPAPLWKCVVAQPRSRGR